MIKLIKNEFRKYSNSYINTVAFAAMLFPALFTSLVYYFTDSFAFTWNAYINSLHLFYGVFLGSLIPSFVAIFSVYFEFKEGTMKKLITYPYTRMQIIISKILYVLIFIIMLYVAAGILVLVSGLLIGLDTMLADAVNVFKLITVTGLSTLILVPMMIYFTLGFKNFVAPVVVTFLGTVVAIPLISLGKTAFFPWAISTNFFFNLSSSEPANFLTPILVFAVYIAIFFILSVVRFRRMDFDG